MSSISSLSSSAALIYQMQQAAVSKSADKGTAVTTSPQPSTVSSDSDHDGDLDAAGAIDTRA